LRAVFDGGECVEVGNEEVSFKTGFFAQFNGGKDGAQEVAQVGPARGLDAGEYAGHGCFLALPHKSKQCRRPVR
jgi:hypothetical protein